MNDSRYLAVLECGKEIIPPERLRNFSGNCHKSVELKQKDEPNACRFQAVLMAAQWMKRGADSIQCADPMPPFAKEIGEQIVARTSSSWLMFRLAWGCAPLDFLHICTRAVGWNPQVMRPSSPNLGPLSQDLLDREATNRDIIRAVSGFSSRFQSHLSYRKVVAGVIATAPPRLLGGLAMCYTRPSDSSEVELERILGIEPVLPWILLHKQHQVIDHELCHHVQDMVLEIMEVDYRAKPSCTRLLWIWALELHATFFGSANLVAAVAFILAIGLLFVLLFALQVLTLSLQLILTYPSS